MIVVIIGTRQYVEHPIPDAENLLGELIRGVTAIFARVRRLTVDNQ